MADAVEDRSTRLRASPSSQLSPDRRQPPALLPCAVGPIKLPASAFLTCAANTTKLLPRPHTSPATRRQPVTRPRLLPHYNTTTLHRRRCDLDDDAANHPSPPSPSPSPSLLTTAPDRGSWTSRLPGCCNHSLLKEAEATLFFLPPSPTPPTPLPRPSPTPSTLAR